MTQLSATQYKRRLKRIAEHPAMSAENITADRSSLDKAAMVMIGIGAILLALTAIGAVVVNGRHALASYAVGVYAVTAISLGAMFWVMVFELVRAGWSAGVRRQFENVMMNIPLCVVLIAPILIFELAAGGVLMHWMMDDADQYLVNKKSSYLNPAFLAIRFVLYAAIWILIATKMWGYSMAQDQTGDRYLVNKARFTSSWGMLLFALSVAFFAFDFLMSPDYRFFSTMWGVYYFAGGTFSAIAVVAIICCIAKFFGRMTGAITAEHTHDMGKLMFGFTVFWAYIAFSQYFLIWYSNIPEEVAWFTHRKENGWEVLGWLLVFGHFLIPFIILLQRPVKRSLIGLSIVGVWLLVMTTIDKTWVVRPMVYIRDFAQYNPGPAGWWLDVVAAAGVFAVWGGFLVRRIGRVPLIPVRDPRLLKALKHKNYV